MILIISTNREPLHDYEFVKPIEDILIEKQIKYKTYHYNKFNRDIINNADKVIICGTSLKDNQFLKDIKWFDWIKKYNKPILGICAGMQIISIIFGAEIKKKQEIGFYKEKFTYEFLGLNNEREVYHLHNNYTTLPKEFEQFNSGEIPQAIKHKNKRVYGVLFHPEVRNKNLIVNFALD